MKCQHCDQPIVNAYAGRWFHVSDVPHPAEPATLNMTIEYATPDQLPIPGTLTAFHNAATMALQAFENIGSDELYQDERAALRAALGLPAKVATALLLMLLFLFPATVAAG